jgi:hypothetical protein
VRRDRNLLRQLLLRIESSPEPRGLEFDDRFALRVIDLGFNFEEEKAEHRDRDYNLLLMHDAGLVSFEKKLEGGEFRGGYVRLTNAGHDALDAVRDDAIWQKILSATPSEAYGIVKAMTSSVGAAALSAALGIR